MKHIYTKSILLSCCFLLIVASGGASSGSDYELFNSTAQKTSVLLGNVQQSNGVTGEIKLLNVSGSLKHELGSVSIDDGEYKLIDTNGADDRKIVSDGKSILIYSSNFTGHYKYMAGYSQTYKIADTHYDAVGIIGIGTKTIDIPKSNIFTYTGEAEAVVITQQQSFDLQQGKATLVADFGSGMVAVTMSDFSKSNTSGDSSPIDEIKIMNMSINGNGFSGGDFETVKAGTVIDILGANSNNLSQGSFFGLKSDGTMPEEVGGLILMQGDLGLISGVYMVK